LKESVFKLDYSKQYITVRMGACGSNEADSSKIKKATPKP
jgi:hypothetical protein